MRVLKVNKENTKNILSVIILSYKTKGAPLPTGVAKCVCVPHHSLDPK